MKEPVVRVLLSGGVLVWLLLPTAASTYTAPQFPQSTVLSGEDIAEAVVRGRNGEVAPYVLNRSIGRGSGPKAVVYTPFVRVALAVMAQVLTIDGATIVPKNAPQWIASPEVLVVVGSPCPGEPACEAGDVVVPIAEGQTRIYIRHEANPSSSSGPAAVGVPIRVIPLRDLRWLGTIPVEEPVVAATFSPQEFRAGSLVRAEWGRWDSVVFVAGGYIQGAELETWR